MCNQNPTVPILAVNLKLDLFNKQLFNTLKSFHHVKSDYTILFKLTILQAQRAQMLSY